MDLKSIDVVIADRQGEVHINAEIDEPAALAIEAALDLLFGYYHFSAILLRLNSNGGQLTGLMHIYGTMVTWRARGKHIRTAAGFRAASAAALLLSLGEIGERQVLTHSTVLFHHVRVDASGVAITSRSAGKIFDSLQRHDKHLIGGLLQHIESGIGGHAAAAAEGRARCALLYGRVSRPKEIILGNSSCTRPKWLAAVSRIYDKCSSVDSLSPYAVYLNRRFALDSAMDLREAYALMLIDSIRGVPDLVPEARLIHQAVPAKWPSRLAP